MRVWLYLLMIWGPLAFGQSNQLHYRIHYDPIDRPGVVQVTMKFHLLGYQNTFLMLPNQFGGNEELYKHIKIIQVKNASYKPTRHPFAVELTNPVPGEMVEVVYEVTSRVSNEAQTLIDARAPIINADYLHMIGNGFMIIPYHFKDKLMEVSLEVNFPNTWEYASSYGYQQKKQTFKVQFQSLLNLVIIGGNYRFATQKIKKNKVVIAIQGQWRFSDAAMHNTLLNVISSVRNFLNDHSDRFYLVVVIPVRGTQRVQAGLGLNNAFSIHLSSKQVLNPELKILLTHEHLHRWITPKIVSDSPDNQEEYFWFTEGFTDYYATLLSLRSGLINLSDYLRYFNRTVEEYLSSSAINLPNRQIAAKFWINYDVGKIAYQRGFLLANHWNRQLKADSTASFQLEDWFKTLIHDYQQKKQHATRQRMIKIMAQSTHLVDVGQDLEQYITQGKTIPIEQDSLGPCILQKWQQVYLTDTGFDPKTSLATGKIAGVIHDGLAYRASLRNGQLVEQIYYSPEDYLKPIVVQIKTGNAVKRIKFQGQKGQTMNMVHFYLSPKAVSRDPERCLKWFGDIKPVY